jgi:hypothetical protein
VVGDLGGARSTLLDGLDLLGNSHHGLEKLDEVGISRLLGGGGNDEEVLLLVEDSLEELGLGDTKRKAVFGSEPDASRSESKSCKIRQTHAMKRQHRVQFSQEEKCFSTYNLRDLVADLGSGLVDLGQVSGNQLLEGSDEGSLVTTSSRGSTSTSASTDTTRADGLLNLLEALGDALKTGDKLGNKVLELSRHGLVF